MMKLELQFFGGRGSGGGKRSGGGGGGSEVSDNASNLMTNVQGLIENPKPVLDSLKPGETLRLNERGNVEVDGDFDTIIKTDYNKVGKDTIEVSTTFRENSTGKRYKETETMDVKSAASDITYGSRPKSASHIVPDKKDKWRSTIQYTIYDKRR